MNLVGTILNGIITISLRHRLAVIVATLLVTAAGLWAFVTLHADAFPDLTPNQVQIMTEAPDFSQVEVEQQVTNPIEIALLGLPRMTGLRSISKFGLSVVSVTFDDDMDFYFARTLVQQRIQAAVMQMPPGVEPMLGPPATAMGEAFQYVVEPAAGMADTASLIDLTNVQQYIIEPMLRTVSGVAAVNAWGGMLQQFQVLIDPNRLTGYNLTFDDVSSALANNNANFAGGYLETGGERLTIRGIGRVSNAADIANVVVATRNTTPVYVGDVARVAIEPAPRYGAVTRDGRGEALSAVVILLKGSNAQDVVRRVEERLKDVERVLPKGVRVRTFYNQGEVVDRTTHTVFRNLLEGSLLVVAVLFLFLRSFRVSILTASVIPLSLLFAFLFMKRAGVTANLMSLGALDFGLIVDASVVMVENFVRRVRSGANESETNESLRAAAFEVARPIVFGVCIIVAVYIPIFTLQGLEGRMFRPMALTVCAAVLGSLILALTYIPAVSSYVLGSHGAHEHTEARWFVRLRDRYERLLGWSQRNRARVMGGAALLLAITLASVPFIGTEFMPKLDEGYLLIETRRAISASLPQGILVSDQVERALRRFPEVATVVTNLGRPHEATETMALFQADVYITLKPRRFWKASSPEQLIERMDSALDEIPGVDYEFSAPMRMRLDEVISGVRTDLGVKIFGDSLTLLHGEAEQAAQAVRRIRGAQDVSVGAVAGSRQLEIDLDRDAIARYGLNTSAVRAAVAAGIGGQVVSEVIEGRRRFPIVVRLEAAFRSTPQDVERLLLRTPNGGSVTLAQLATVRVTEGPEVIEHEDGQRYVVVRSNVRGRDLGGFAADVKTQITSTLRLPPGYHVKYSGQFENQARATKRLSVIVPLVLLIISGLLYASFGSVRHALLVMLNVPFALIGGIAALWLRGLLLNLSASVGFIALFGVAVLNGVVLITYINQLRQEGSSLEEAVAKGSAVRLRPVLMTALVASLGFLPMALSSSAGAEIQRPLATVVIGGLITSTLLTLLVLPTLYQWLEESMARRRGKAA